MSRYCLIPWGFGASNLEAVGFWEGSVKDNLQDVSDCHCVTQRPSIRTHLVAGQYLVFFPVLVP